MNRQRTVVALLAAVAILLALNLVKGEPEVQAKRQIDVPLCFVSVARPAVAVRAADHSSGMVGNE